MIYLITNNINGKRYIGKTKKTLEQRWYQHCKTAERGSSTHLHRSIQKYGKNNFTIQFLCEGLNNEEILMIETYVPEYNMTRGGDGGDTSNSPNYKKAILRRDMSGSNNPNYGKKGKDSPNFGRRYTEEQKQIYRDAYKGKRIAVRVNGIDYESVSRAAKLLGRSERYVRLHDELNEWSY